MRAIITCLKKVGIFCVFYPFAGKAMKLCFLVIFFIQLACVPNLFKFEFTDNYNIIDSTFDLYNIFMYGIVWTSNSRISVLWCVSLNYKAMEITRCWLYNTWKIICILVQLRNKKSVDFWLQTCSWRDVCKFKTQNGTISYSVRINYIIQWAFGIWNTISQFV